jgi:hypothetical protein
MATKDYETQSPVLDMPVDNSSDSQIHWTDDPSPHSPTDGIYSNDEFTPWNQEWNFDATGYMFNSSTEYDKLFHHIYALAIAGIYPETQKNLVPAHDLVAIRSSMIAYNATLELDTAIAPGPGIVPYNSTLWFNGTGYELSAPFLNADRACSWFGDPLGSCLCYDDNPIYTDWRTNLTGANMKCINDNNSYIWGFSSFICLIGLALEIWWIFGCW